jgi:phospholipase C
MYGPRVGLLAVSPYAKRGYVTHVVTDHTSLLRFVEARFNIPAMTKRDANATPPFDMFDFSKKDTSIPTLREAVIDPPDAHGC